MPSRKKKMKQALHTFWHPCDGVGSRLRPPHLRTAPRPRLANTRGTPRLLVLRGARGCRVGNHVAARAARLLARPGDPRACAPTGRFRASVGKRTARRVFCWARVAWCCRVGARAATSWVSRCTTDENKLSVFEGRRFGRFE